MNKNDNIMSDKNINNVTNELDVKAKKKKKEIQSIEMLDIHKEIKNKLKYFHDNSIVPNIIFHGPSGCGKKTLVNYFISMIYNHDKDKIKHFVMYVNCAQGKGIKFIRDELKFFAKTNINSINGYIFKSIILLNADKLTTDAQSALRRCIELFSHNTRFFLIVEDKYKLLKPILSRFCEIFVNEPIVNNETINLYRYNLNKIFDFKSIKSRRELWLKKFLDKNMSNINSYIYEENIDIDNDIDNDIDIDIVNNMNNDIDNGNKINISTNINTQKINSNNKNIELSNLINISTKLYNNGYSAIDLINLIENRNINNMTLKKKYELLNAFNKVKKEFRNEKLLIIFILNFTYLSLNNKLENISFI
jgi:DNA polymerase III delta prime subunit